MSPDFAELQNLELWESVDSNESHRMLFTHPFIPNPELLYHG